MKGFDNCPYRVTTKIVSEEVTRQGRLGHEFEAVSMMRGAFLAALLCRSYGGALRSTRVLRPRHDNIDKSKQDIIIIEEMLILASFNRVSNSFLESEFKATIFKVSVSTTCTRIYSIVSNFYTKFSQ